ncbi:hypothetical protein J2W68_003035 [Luteimonas terrae]|uniref:Uncharacterized protein n=1 Tax=Luteimonas terrae TaxID=1530191 RepID=A0ABU1XZU7_9GAMM|nr:hypothetical protein [Luteimonas terrae]
MMESGDWGFGIWDSTRRFSATGSLWLAPDRLPTTAIRKLADLRISESQIPNSESP